MAHSWVQSKIAVHSFINSIRWEGTKIKNNAFITRSATGAPVIEWLLANSHCG